MSPYLAERWAEEVQHLRFIPGANKRRDAATMERIAHIERELRQLSVEGVGKRRSRLPCQHQGS
jgi:hypothetical protein